MQLTPDQKLAIQQLGSNNFTGSIANITLNSLERRGLIKRIGDYYHQLTETGERVYCELSDRPAKWL